MFAVGALVVFVLGLILDIANVGGDWVGWLPWIGFALISAHLAYGNRFMRRM